MLDLLQNKIRTNRFANVSEKNAAKNTVNGFIAHNVADKIVHFSYFLDSTQANWIEQHGFKEIYTEYLFVKDKGFASDANAMFYENGAIRYADIPIGTALRRFPFDTIFGIPFLTGNSGDTAITAKLMCLSQQAFEKSRAIWRINSTFVSTGPFVADPVSRIITDLGNAELECNLQEGKTYWARPRWATWRANVGPFYSNLATEHPYTDTNGVAATIPVNEPNSLKDEYSQLCDWYDWSHTTELPTSILYWDDVVMWGKYNASVQAIKDAIRSDADLEPRNP